MKKQSKGFTLVELLAVIVVLALIMVIAIPSILNTTNAAKKESFFLYAESLQSKAIAQYTQDLEHKKENTECAVYDISKDLNISNTGNYEGWVKVVRTPTQSGKKSAFIEINSDKPLKYVRYCMAKANDCTPDQSFYVKEDDKKAIITKTLDEGYVLCANYQVANGDKLVSSTKKCVTYNDPKATLIYDSYDYDVIMTIKDDSYAVENLTFNDEMSSDSFFKAIDSFKNNHSDRSSNKLAISAPTCTNDSTVGNKGTTTTKTTKVTTTTTTTGTVNVSTTTTTTGTVNVTTTTTTKKGDIYVTTTTTTRGTNVITSAPTTEQSTVQHTTTTADPKDESLHLSSLSVSGYEIGFDKLKYNYEITVPNSVTSINVNATPMTDITSVAVSGNTDLGEGINVVVVSLFNTETGKSSNYRIIVKRLNDYGEVISTTRKTQDPNYNPQEGLPDPTLEESNALLRQLTVSGYLLDFSPEVYDYTLETNGEEKLTVSYKTASRTAYASISGTENASDGSQIVVVVQSQNGYYKKTYTINIVHKKEESSGTKYLKGVAVGLGVVLAAALSAIAISKRKKKKLIDDSNSNNNQNNQGNVI